MALKRQWFRPGRRIEQISTAWAQPFFTRRKKSDAEGPAQPPTRRPLTAEVAEHAGALFSIAISLVLVIAIFALIFAFVRDIGRDTVLIDGFSAPDDVVKAGYTPAAIAGQIIDEVRLVQSKASTLRERREVDSSSALADIQVAGGGISMRAIVRYARQLFDLPSNRIGGEILREGNALRIVLRTQERRSGRTIEIKRDDGDIRLLLKDAGREIVKLADPYVLADYLYDVEYPGRQFTSTLAVIDYMLKNAEKDDDVWALDLLGSVRQAQGRPDEAIAAYRRALQRAPGFSIAVDHLAGALYWSGRVDEANAIIPVTAPDAHLSPNALRSRAQILDTINRFEEALAYAQAAVRAAPKDGSAHAKLAEQYSALHRDADALAAAEDGKRIAANPDRIDWIHVRSLATLHRGSEALEVADKALALSPDDEQLIYARGTALASLDRHEEAIVDFARALEALRAVGGGSVPAVAYGDSLLALGRRDEALAMMWRAAQIDPTWGATHAGVGRALLASDRPGDAAKSFEKAFKYDRHDPEALRDWGRALDALGRGTEADAKRKLAEAVERENTQPLAMLK